MSRVALNRCAFARTDRVEIKRQLRIIIEIVLDPLRQQLAEHIINARYHAILLLSNEKATCVFCN